MSQRESLLAMILERKEQAKKVEEFDNRFATEQDWRDWIEGPNATFEVLVDNWKCNMPKKFNPRSPTSMSLEEIRDLLERKRLEK